MSENKTMSISIEEYRSAANQIEAQLSKVIVGQQKLVRDLLITLLAGGNGLLEGVPGLGKTILVKTLAEVLDCSYNRVQFTPDLMPADIIGSTILVTSEQGEREFKFEKGPLFANLVLADEINRAAPRTQSALLEAMQEGSVTVGGSLYQLPKPFFVLATQNPIEMEGTYPLPEAQLDRFLFKLEVPYPSEDELVEIAKRTTGAELPKAEQVASAGTLMAMQFLSKQVPIADQVYRYVARLVNATRPDSPEAIDSVRRHLRVGASPRGVQAVVWGAKVAALLDNRKAVAIEDVHGVVFPALRHRILLNFEAQAEQVNPDEIIAELLRVVPVS
ncbi:MAG: MoxR family ATPase [Chloroflexota bacterium]